MSKLGQRKLACVEATTSANGLTCFYRECPELSTMLSLFIPLSPAAMNAPLFGLLSAGGHPFFGWSGPDVANFLCCRKLEALGLAVNLR